MKSLVVYDSLFGNTEKVARTVQNALQTAKHQAKISHVTSISPNELSKYDLLVVGSPTHGGRPTPEINSFLQSIPTDTNHPFKVAVYDTRMDPISVNKGLQLLMSLIGFAAPKMAKSLKQKGVKLAGEPAGFIVEDREGPLRTGELERVEQWANSLKS